MNLEGFDRPSFEREVVAVGALARLDPADLWVLARSLEVAREVGDLLGAYRLDLAAHTIYQFVWYELCDWYLELVKPSLASEADPEVRRAAQGCLVTVLDVVLRVLHPFLPFITEELWQQLPRAEGDRECLMIAAFPEVREWSGEGEGAGR